MYLQFQEIKWTKWMMRNVKRKSASIDADTNIFPSLTCLLTNDCRDSVKHDRRPGPRERDPSVVSRSKYRISARVGERSKTKSSAKSCKEIVFSLGERKGTLQHICIGKKRTPFAECEMRKTISTVVSRAQAKYAHSRHFQSSQPTDNAFLPHRLQPRRPRRDTQTKKSVL